MCRTSASQHGGTPQKIAILKSNYIDENIKDVEDSGEQFAWLLT